jgi:hypothetical protein
LIIIVICFTIKDIIIFLDIITLKTPVSCNHNLFVLPIGVLLHPYFNVKIIHEGDYEIVEAPVAAHKLVL